jgi:hypothetical protein
VDAYGERWFIAAHCIADLFDDPRHPERRPKGSFMQALYNISFVEVRTEGGRCCVVDIFTYDPTTAQAGVTMLKVGHKTEAEWGLMRDPERERRWLRKPLRELIPEDREPIPLFRFRPSEQFLPKRRVTGGWPDHAASLLRTGVAFFINTNWSAPVETLVGSFTYEGQYDYYDVAFDLISKGAAV